MKQKYTKKPRNESCIDNLHRIVIRKDIRDALKWTPGTQIEQCIKNGGVYLSVAKDVCRICYCKGKNMFMDFGICTMCAYRIKESLNT